LLKIRDRTDAWARDEHHEPAGPSMLGRYLFMKTMGVRLGQKAELWMY